MPFDTHGLGRSEVRPSAPGAGEPGGAHASRAPREAGAPGSPGEAGQIGRRPGGRADEGSWSEQVLRYLRANPGVIEVPPQAQRP